MLGVGRALHTAMLIGYSLEVAGCHSGLEVMEGVLKQWRCDTGHEAGRSHRWTAKRRRYCTHADLLLLVEMYWAFGVHYWTVLTLWSLWHSRTGRSLALTLQALFKSPLEPLFFLSQSCPSAPCVPHIPKSCLHSCSVDKDLDQLLNS